jgi:hypothetical protein
MHVYIYIYIFFLSIKLSYIFTRDKILSECKHLQYNLKQLESDNTIHW